MRDDGGAPSTEPWSEIWKTLEGMLESLSILVGLREGSLGLKLKSYCGVIGYLISVLLTSIFQSFVAVLWTSQCLSKKYSQETRSTLLG